MKKGIHLILIILLSHYFSSAQKYEFTLLKEVNSTHVKNQGSTGTCWSFSTASFIESEIQRLSGTNIDISEMYFVRNTYLEKSWNYIMRQGKTQFGEGGLSHDVINSIEKYGIVPRSAFSGLINGENQYDHQLMFDLLHSKLKESIDSKSPNKWRGPVDSLLNYYIGENPITFSYNDKTYTPESFLLFTNFKTKDYVSITSFNHTPFYNQFILNIPDNFSNGSFYNVPLGEMIDIINHALNNGFTIELDIDVSEPTFFDRKGIAVLPSSREDIDRSISNIVTEREITQENRQEAFENYSTTDDHLMHITGILTDQKGNIYYKVKNSWGDKISHEGYIYISEAYMKMKTISILLHKKAIPYNLRNKLRI